MTNDDILGRTVRFGDQTGRVVATITEPSVVVRIDEFTSERITVPLSRVEVIDAPCTRCNGRGVIDSWSQGMHTEPRCPNCHGTRFAVPK